MFTNAQILTKIILKFIEPVFPAMMTNWVSKASWIGTAENMLKRIGIVSPNYSLAQELSTGIGSIGGEALLRPMLEANLSKLPDDAIPAIFHALADKGIAAGHVELLDGYIKLDKNDLKEFKKYLDYNLPIKKSEEYVLKTAPDTESEPTATGAEENDD